MGIASSLVKRKIKKAIRNADAVNLPVVDTPVNTRLINKPEKLEVETNVSFETEEALEMLSNEKSIEAWKTNNKVPKEESKRRKQRKFSEQAKDLEAGIMSGPAYRKYIKENQPATSFSEKDLDTMLPNFKNVVGALTKDKSDKGILGLNNNLEKGSVVTSRLDIPAYNEYNVWVTSIVDKIKGKLYGRTAVLKNVNFDMTNEGAKRLALDIATEKKKTKKVLNKKTQERVTEEYTQTKTPFATMKGEWQDVLDEDAFSLAKKYINDPDWIQVGFNPERHSFFYDKATMMPVFEAEEVVQVGALVLAKVKKLNTPELRAARIAKLRKLRITNMPEGAKPTTFNKGGAILMNNQMQQFAEGGLKDEGGMIDEVSGNEVPIGGTKEGVRDDIPANVSEGEFIFPADVVRFVGLDKLMSIRQDAKMGLRKMEDMGQMGNSDEATMPDDMPFGMADIMVIGDKGEPMEFANGGFVPSYAPGGLLGSVASNLLGVQEYDNQQLVNPPVNLTGDPYFNNEDVDINDVRNAAIIDPDPNYQPSMEELQTAYVPTTGTEEIDYDAYMNSVTTVTKEYRNAAGESIVITFINGVPTLPIPDGYTLYNAEAGGGGAVSLAGQVVAQSNTSSRAEDNRQDRDRSPVIAPEPINYSAMSDEEFASQMITESSGLHQFGRAIGIGVASMVPFGLLLVGGSMRSHARKSEARLNTMIEGASGEYKAELIAIRDGFLKANSLKPAALSNSLVAAADSFLMGDGYTSEQRVAASVAISSSDAGQDNEAIQNSINNILGKNKTDGAYSEIDDGTETNFNLVPKPNTLPFDPTGVGDTQGDTGQSIQQYAGLGTGTATIPAGGLSDDAFERFTESTNMDAAFNDYSTSAEPRLAEAKRERDLLAEAYYTTGAGRDGATSPVDYSNVIPSGYDFIPQPVVSTPEPYDSQRMIDVNKIPARSTEPPFIPTSTSSQTVDAFGTPYETRSLANAMDKSNEGLSSTANFIQAQQEAARAEANRPNFFQNKDMSSAISNLPNDIGSGLGKAGTYVYQNYIKGITPKERIAKASPQSPPGAMVGTGRPSFPSSIGVDTPTVTQQSTGYDEIELQSGNANSRTTGFSGGYDQIPQGYTAPINQQPDATSGYDFIPQNISGTQQQTNRILGLSPGATGGPNVMQPPSTQLETSAQQKIRLKNENTNRRLRAEQAAADARQNNAFQNAANELTPNDDKEYRKGILISTKEGDNNKQINTAYQTAANLATPGDGNTYVGGILKNSAGKQINNAYQNAANALTPNDDRSYVGGKLMSDADPTMPYVASYQNRDRSTVDPNNPTGGKNTSAEAMAANMAAFKQKFGRAGNSTNPATKSGYSAAQLAAANQRNIAAGSATVNSYGSSGGKTASDRANEAEQQAHADSKSSGPKTSFRPKARPKKKTTKRYSGSGGFFDRAEGGLIQKPTTTKKPAKAKTKKRGLAARK